MTWKRCPKCKRDYGPNGGPARCPVDRAKTIPSDGPVPQ